MVHLNVNLEKNYSPIPTSPSAYPDAKNIFIE